MKGMSPWMELKAQNLENIPARTLGVFQLKRGEGNIAYVGRSDDDIRASLAAFLGKEYTHFQWVQLPWTKEAFEMQCRLFHHAGGLKHLDNDDHPYPPEGHFWNCPLSSRSPANCDS